MRTSKINRPVMIITIFLLCASTIGTAFAGGRHGHFGIYLGAPVGFGYYPYYRTPYFGAPYYGYPNYGGMPYYYPAHAYYPQVQSAPVIYTERSDSPQTTNVQTSPGNVSQNVQQSWWYYCADTKTYYPYVQQCSGGWMRVAPQPAPGSGNQPAIINAPAQ